MNNIVRIGITIVSGAFLVFGAWALPATPPSSQDAPKAAAELQSVSGTISTVQTDSFTLVTTSSATRGQNFQQNPGESRTMMFIIDKNTTVDGKLKVGANADVVYRQDNGNNMAVSVTVSK